MKRTKWLTVEQARKEQEKREAKNRKAKRNLKRGW
jgi:hypothetical protein